ncbi:hypothetical protein RUM44_005975 [Polyplax serrata]|uniref:Uncharacterized protein n=1 Tax=Polyplax serrata TaxID=468196 RepID=A0ABR1AYM5_POLSC
MARDTVGSAGVSGGRGKRKRTGCGTRRSKEMLETSSAVLDFKEENEKAKETGSRGRRKMERQRHSITRCRFHLALHLPSLTPPHPPPPPPPSPITNKGLFLHVAW